MINQTKKPLFSIITVCYNAAGTIERAIQSVLNQSVNDLEYIIVDGASTDRTMKIVEKYRDDIAHIISEPDEGIYHAMNKGLELATGEVVGIINSDDWYEPGSLEIIKNAYEYSDKETIFYGLCKYIQDGREGLILSYHHDILPERNIAHPTCFVPKAIYQQIGPFNTEYKVAADYDFLLRCYLNDLPFTRIDRVIANFRSGGYSEVNDGLDERSLIQLSHGVIDKKRFYLRKMVQFYRRWLDHFFGVIYSRFISKK